MKWNYGGSDGKESAWDVGDWVWSLGWRDPLEKGIAAHSSILAWRIPWREKSGRLQPMGSQRVGHYWATNTTTQSKNTAVRLWQWLQRRCAGAMIFREETVHQAGGKCFCWSGRWHQGGSWRVREQEAWSPRGEACGLRSSCQSLFSLLGGSHSWASVCLVTKMPVS